MAKNKPLGHTADNVGEELNIILNILCFTLARGFVMCLW